MRTVFIAKDFSVLPGGRVPAGGPFSGGEFRDIFLVPIFSGTEKLQIDFDQVRGYRASFLEPLAAC